MVGVNEHAATLFLEGPYASFDPARLMMRIYSRVRKSLALLIAVVLPLAAGKDSIVCVVVLDLYGICFAKLFESCFRHTNFIATLGPHEVDIAKIRKVIAEHRDILVSLPCQKPAHLRYKPRSSGD